MKLSIIIALLAPCGVALGMNVEIKSNVEFSNDMLFDENVTSPQVEKRGFHEDAPLFYIEDRHPGEFFWSEPYYPSRMY